MGDLKPSGEFAKHTNQFNVNISLFQVAAMSSKSGSGSKRKAGVGEGGGGGKREGRREKVVEKEKTRGGRESRGEGSIDRPSVFSRLGTKMGGANRGSASNSSGAPAWSNRGSF